MEPLRLSGFLCLVLVVFVAAGVAPVAGDSSESGCSTPELCTLVCKTPKTDMDGNVCAVDGTVQGTSYGTCICTDKVEPDKRITCTEGEKMGKKCEPCIETTPKQQLYTCNVIEGALNGDEGGLTSSDYYCACAPTTMGAEQNKGRRRGKFPPILAQLLAALQQVRSRFSGRQ